MADYHFKRCAKVQNYLDREKLDAALVTSEVNVRWLTGFTGGDAALLVLPERWVLLSDSRFTLQIPKECPGLEFAMRAETGLFGLAAKLLPKGNLRLAIEADAVTLAQAETIQKHVDAELVPMKSLIERFRAIKDKYEIAALREAARIARNAFNGVCAGLTPDKTEKQIADELDFGMRQLGATRAGFPTITAVGANAAFCHAVPGPTRVAEDDFLLVDWGAEYNGYTSDLTRTVVTGRLTRKFQTLYTLVLEAQQAAINAIRPGERCCEIHHVARRVLAAQKCDKYFTHGLGHSVGLQIHESPTFSPYCETVLKPGMVLTVEPGVYIKGWGGIRIEDDILVTRDGCEVLTDAAKELEQIILR